MPSITSYLTFNGNCRQAMTFYRDCLGGELLLETIGDSLPATMKGARIPCEMKLLVVQATLIRGELVIVGTDMGNERQIVKGNAVAMLLNCDSEAEAREAYRKLSDGGQQTHPLEDSIWGSLCGDLCDRFGNNWLIQFNSDKMY